MKLIPLSNSDLLAVVDPEDRRLNRRSWRLDESGYVYTEFGGRTARRRVHLHQAILWTPRGMVVDHANGNPLDNRRSNLRPATPSQNAANTRRLSRNVHGFRGVTQRQYNRRWTAQI